MKPDSESVIQQSKNWIDEVVIGLNLCPFARQVFVEHSIDYIIADDDHIENHLQQLAHCFLSLDTNKSIETSLLIFPDSYNQFDDYLELYHLANQLLRDIGYEGIYQLASFHSDYVFVDSDEHDASNFSNRSPYPMLHILREKSIEQAIALYKNIEAVPENNIKRLQEIGYDKMSRKLVHCRQDLA